jgi:hypothetical protein
MTQYDIGRTEIPFGPLDVCILVSHFLVQDSSIEGTPHQCPFRGIVAEPLNLAITTTRCTIINKASYYSPLNSNCLWTLIKASSQYPLGVASHSPHARSIRKGRGKDHQMTAEIQAQRAPMGAEALPPLEGRLRPPVPPHIISQRTLF